MPPRAVGGRSVSFLSALERFNLVALRLARPRESWFLTSLKIGVVMTAAATLLSILVVSLLTLLRGSVPHGTMDTSWHHLLELIVLAPLFETALLVLIFKLTVKWAGLTGFMAILTVLAALVHIPNQPILLPAAIAFMMMSYEYASFRQAVGPGRAFAGVAVSHATINTFGASLFLALRLFA